MSFAVLRFYFANIGHYHVARTHGYPAAASQILISSP